MDALAALSTIAAIAVTLTGFAGLLAAFRNSDRWQPVELFAVRYLLLTSASGCLLALLPIPMAVGRYDDFWRPCLLILTAWLLLTIGWTLTETVRRKTRPRRPIRYVVTQAAGLGLAGWAVLTALNARARTDRRAAGQVHGPEIVLRDGTACAADLGRRLAPRTVAKIIGTETSRVYGELVKGQVATPITDLSADLAKKIATTVTQKGVPISSWRA